MRSLVPIVTVALALMLPASAAFARPADEPASLGGGAHSVEVSSPPVAGAEDGSEPLGYILVGLGGFALGAAGFAGASGARRSRRVLEA
jgi:hypothetical protein